MPVDKFQIRLLSIAEDDFTEIISFIALDNPDAAVKTANTIEHHLELLSENPFLGRTPRDIDIRNLGYRYIIVLNYLIFYTIEDKIICIAQGTIKNCFDFAI